MLVAFLSYYIIERKERHVSTNKQSISYITPYSIKSVLWFSGSLAIESRVTGDHHCDGAAHPRPHPQHTPRSSL